MQKTKKRRWLVYIIVLAVLAALTLATALIVHGYNTGDLALFPRRSPVFTASELNFDVGRSRVFAESNGTVAAAGTFGIQVINADGEETLRDTFRLYTPAIVEHSGTFLAFDIGGTSLRKFTSNQILSEVTTTGQIVSATLNRNGWFTVVTQEPGAFRGTVQVYNSAGSVVYRVDLGSGFPITAKLSDNNNNLAILNLTNTGSRVTFYNGIDEDKEDPDFWFELTDTVMFDFEFISNDEILAISTESVLRSSTTGESVELFSFRGRRLGSYALGEDFIALNLYDYGVGYSGQIITIDPDDGAIIAQNRIHREIVSMSVNYGWISILQSNEITFFNKLLEEYRASEEAVMALATNRILVLGENVALATSDNSALIVHRIQNN
jgi:hypothetical protein